ncbi:DNA polymerase III subunit beta [Paenibacillus sp. B2(2019)]|uniref:DNA polymerase III subunit beta n=1 Tax=Paenibacillus sp. B2(2019) TaxID=2607754 RepID=UPI0011F1B905|nr:DNA polymerase III subunit beta [Paenibacillus sp. B2(2019)]KAA1191070.1 DNA polymerase III subunit beta [Paenibacillus sp. B2(2019)]
MRSLLIHVSKDSLSTALQAALKAISANSSSRVLSGIHIQAQAEGLTLTASNISMTIEYKLPVKMDSMIVHKPGEIVVPARYFYEIIRKLDPGLIRLEIAETLILNIQSGNTQFRLCGMDTAEFPRIHYVDHPNTQKIRMKNTLLKQIFKHVVFAVSSLETRPVLTGVSLQIDNQNIRVVATDGIRLAQHVVENVEDYGASPLNVIIPGSTLEDLLKIINDDEGSSTQIEIGQKQIRFISDGLRVQSALLEGTYPYVDNLIPQVYISEVIVKTERLLRVVERIAILAGESVTLGVYPSGILHLISRAADVGEAKEEIPLEYLEGEYFRVAFNGKYFRDILRAIDSETLRIRFAGKERPLVIQPVDMTSSTLFLITPMRTQDGG